jgi:hypothetical protein
MTLLVGNAAKHRISGVIAGPATNFVYLSRHGG